MEGMRDVALAHYETLPDDKKTKIQSDFKRTVEERSVGEYFHQFHHEFDSEIVGKCLKSCKEYEEGRLDFNNYITLMYILENLEVGICNECSSLILGKVFFSCYECFVDSDEDSYELCCSCYGSKKFKGHKHVKFCDSQTLYYSSTRMLARKKRKVERRKSVIDKMIIDMACHLMKQARSIKTKRWTIVDHALFKVNKNKKLVEISRLAKELKEKSNGKKGTDESSSSSEEEEHEDTEDEENSSRFHRRIDLLGMAPSRSKGRDSRKSL